MIRSDIYEGTTSKIFFNRSVYLCFFLSLYYVEAKRIPRLGETSISIKPAKVVFMLMAWHSAMEKRFRPTISHQIIGTIFFLGSYDTECSGECRQIFYDVSCRKWFRNILRILLISHFVMR